MIVLDLILIIVAILLLISYKRSGETFSDWLLDKNSFSFILRGASLCFISIRIAFVIFTETDWDFIIEILTYKF